MAKRIERSALVPYSAAQMYALVNDIESYPQFMNGCVGAEVLERGDDYLKARLDLKKGKLAKSFVTRNELVPNERIELHLVEGPFRMLQGIWTFTPLSEEACKVRLDLSFEFQSKLLALAADPWFESVGNHLVSEVCERAKEVYS